MSKANEKKHDEFFYDLCDITEKAQDLGVPHMVYVGIQFFTQMALDCAPSVKDGKDLIKDAMKSVKKESI